MEISIAVAEAGEFATRWHYCLERGRIIGFGCVQAVDEFSGLQSPQVNLACALLRDLPRVRTSESLTEPAEARYIYAITDGNAIKIGWSARHPTVAGSRLSRLQTAHHADLRLIGAVISASTLEADLHRRFGEFHIRGEWFRYAPAIVEYFDPQ
ncbi:MAG TPA: GIY-YIG nuclease family protein [Candidatus Baltobacteraceae bacterium]